MVRPILCVLGFVAGLSHAQAQCPTVAPGFGPGGVGGTIHDLLTVDLGSGPELFAGGSLATMGSAVTSGVARFDGHAWSALGGGVGVSSSEFVWRLAAVDFGGPKLCVFGRFHTVDGRSASGVALWNGASFDVLGGGPSAPGKVLFLKSAAVFDDGGGPRLFVAGSASDLVTGDSDPFLAGWDGTTWTKVEDAPASDVCPSDEEYCLRAGSIDAMATFDDGAGPALFAAGDFEQVGGAPGFNFARWDGSTWFAPGGGIGGASGSVDRLIVHDDGRGAALFLQGRLTGAVDPRVVRWNGTRFSALAVPPALGPGDFVSLPGFAGIPAGLWLLVSRPNNGSTVRAARWNGTSWASFEFPMDDYGSTEALEVFDSGSGPELFVGGSYHTIGNVVAAGVAAFDGASWHGFDPGLGLTNELTSPGHVAAFAVHDDGSGPALYAAGQFDWTGGDRVINLVRWSGERWQAIPGQTLVYDTFIRKLLSADVGQGPSLYMAGDIMIGNAHAPFARWDGHALTAMGTGLDVFDVAVFDAGTGPKLYAVSGASLMRLDGNFFTNVFYESHADLKALAVYDDGNGPALYVGGRFTTFGGVTSRNIVRYDGNGWSGLIQGLGRATSFDFVQTLRSHDDGSGAKLYAGGRFLDASGVAVSNLAAWNGKAWTDVGGGLSRDADGTASAVNALETFDDGTGGGEALFVGGSFASAGGVPAANLAKWDGSSWSAAGLGTAGIDPTVRALSSVELPSFGGRTLLVGGDFEALGGTPSQRFGRIEPCGAAATAFCFGDGSARACPCENSGASRHGCQNSAWSGGALLTFTGATSPDTAVLHVSGLLPHSLTIFLQGNSTLAPGVNFGDGLRCAGGVLKRLYAKDASGGAASAPDVGDPSITARSAALGDPIPAGHRRYYQAYYRDGDASFCAAPSGSSFNSSNGLKIVW